MARDVAPAPVSGPYDHDGDPRNYPGAALTPAERAEAQAFWRLPLYGAEARQALARYGGRTPDWFYREL